MMYIKGISRNSIRLTIFEQEAMYLFGTTEYDLFQLRSMGIKSHFGQYGILVYDGWYDE